ncbi:MAG: DUF1343 domain-containing protein [Ignavibacteriales bacterium]|nr:DUF1343 domain-containing protein [Ignavibacteriales bacterium]
MRVTLGLEVLSENPLLARSWGRCGLLLNQASVDAEMRPAQLVLKKALKNRLTVLFSPQHGLFADKQDNMIESGHGRDFLSGLPFYSLYSEVREPSPSMLEGLETVMIDIQDVGTRVYTFVSTMAGIMRACAKGGKRVVVLDRPNPIGGAEVEGNVLEEDSKSYVGEYPLPMRHGMTMGELAGWINTTAEINVELEVIRMKGWRRTMHWAETGRFWVMTSPNMPTPETAEMYPGMVLLEGTNLSEGRGTTVPFLMVGAPYLRSLEEWLKVLSRISDLSGIAIRPAVFEPTFQKWAKTTCWGAQFVVVNPGAVRSYQLALGVLLASIHLAPEDFRFNDPPYEYETVRPPIQLLLGSSSLPGRLLELGKSDLKRGAVKALERTWQTQLKEFERQRKEFLLYR